MNVWSWILFPFIFAYFFVPAVCGIIEIVNYKLSRINRKKREFSYILIQLFSSLLLCSATLILIFYLWYKILYLAFMDYIVSVLCCLLISITASNKIYLPAGIEIDSSLKAFKKGFTECISSGFFHFLPTKTIVHVFYLVILIASHIVTLYFVDSSVYGSDFYRFLEINKYGIVIMYAFEKIITSISSKEEKERIQTLKEISDKLEEDKQKEHEELQQKKQELMKLLESIRMARLEKKRQNKKR